jgi:hypothetical protein
MDALTPSGVIWRPFESHRGSIAFDPVTMYIGYLRGCPVVPYLPERCFRQFGYLQCIPPPPPPPPAISVIDSDLIGYEISVDRILQLTPPARYVVEATNDYLQWFYPYHILESVTLLMDHMEHRQLHSMHHYQIHNKMIR